MPNPTRQEIIDANSALASLVCVALSNTSDPDEKDWIKTEGRAIAAVLPPRPRPTMDEIEWDNERHYLAEAETGKGLKAIMLRPVPDMGILCLQKANGTHRPYYFKTDYLTPTGKRYTLTEMQE